MDNEAKITKISIIVMIVIHAIIIYYNSKLNISTKVSNNLSEVFVISNNKISKYYPALSGTPYAWSYYKKY